VVKYFADDRRLGNEPDDTHALAAMAEKRVDLVDTPDEAGPRFPAGCKPGTVGSRRIGRLVLRWHREEDFAPARDPSVGVRVGAVVVDEMRSPIGNVGSEAGDPLQVVVVPVAGGCPPFSVIGDGSLGKVPHFRFLDRIDAEATGCGRSPYHVESHAQRVLDVGNLLAGVSMKPRVSPFPHPLDQFRRDHPLLAQQGQDVGLEEVPQYGGVEEGRVNETAVRPKGPCGSQDMQVGMPVQKLPGGLDGNNGGGKSVPFRVFPEEHGKGFPGAQGKLGEKPPPVPEGRPQDLGECEYEMPVGDGADHLLADELCPQGGALGGAEGAETPLIAGEGKEFISFIYICCHQ
jgi:hypothetical protein